MRSRREKQSREDNQSILVIGGINWEGTLPKSKLGDLIVEKSKYSKLLADKLVAEQSDKFEISSGEINRIKDLPPGMENNISWEWKGSTFVIRGLVQKELAAGGAANVALNIKHLGEGNGDVCLVGMIAKDEKGKWMESYLKRKGVDCEPIQRQEQDGSWLTLNVPGENASALLMYKYDALFKGKEVQQTLDAVEEQYGSFPGVTVALTGWWDMPLLKAILKRRTQIYLCPSMRLIVELPDERVLKVFERSEFVVMNRAELQVIVDKLDLKLRLDSDRDIAAAIQVLRDFGWKNLIITDGSHGVFTLFEGGPLFYSAYQLSENQFIDDTGAGDAFAGSFVWRYFVDKKSLPEAVQFACTYAAYTLTGEGATGNFQPDAKKTEELIRNCKEGLCIKSLT